MPQLPSQQRGAGAPAGQIAEAQRDAAQLDDAPVNQHTVLERRVDVEHEPGTRVDIDLGTERISLRHRQ